MNNKTIKIKIKKEGVVDLVLYSPSNSCMLVGKRTH
jgi:hypothetical protein